MSTLKLIEKRTVYEHDNTALANLFKSFFTGGKIFAGNPYQRKICHGTILEYSYGVRGERGLLTMLTYP